MGAKIIKRLKAGKVEGRKVKKSEVRSLKSGVHAVNLIHSFSNSFLMND